MSRLTAVPMRLEVATGLMTFLTYQQPDTWTIFVGVIGEQLAFVHIYDLEFVKRYLIGARLSDHGIIRWLAASPTGETICLHQSGSRWSITPAELARAERLWQRAKPYLKTANPEMSADSRRQLIYQVDRVFRRLQAA
jgi:hypothetical protein